MYSSADGQRMVSEWHSGWLRGRLNVQFSKMTQQVNTITEEHPAYFISGVTSCSICPSNSSTVDVCV